MVRQRAQLIAGGHTNIPSVRLLLVKYLGMRINQSGQDKLVTQINHLSVRCPAGFAACYIVVTDIYDDVFSQIVLCSARTSQLASASREPA